MPSGTVRSACAALAGALALAVAPTAASAASKEAHGLHDARYCEIIELRGAPPDALAVVWNTIGLNTYPAAQWEAFDADAGQGAR